MHHSNSEWIVYWNFFLAASASAAAASAADTSKRTIFKIEPISIGLGDGHMTSEEIERHLEAKQSLRDLMPEKTPLTLPIEIFSNDLSEMEWLVKHLFTIAFHSSLWFVATVWSLSTYLIYLDWLSIIRQIRLRILDFFFCVCECTFLS